MPTLYPTGRDEFGEPSTPDQTPLSSAGTSTRNHVEHHRDLGDAVEALQVNSSTNVHDHSGVADAHGNKTSKLKQVNTHELADTDKSATSLHHTLGKGAFQAAPGNHVHDFNSNEIINKPFQICTSSTRPSNPIVGMQIYESDTNAVRVWSQLAGESSPRWVLTPGSSVPIATVYQSTQQRILSGGSIIEWNVVEEDRWGMVNLAANRTEFVIKEPGLYDVLASIAWNPSDIFGDHAYTDILVNGVSTKFTTAEFIRGNLFKPGFSQTVTVSGKLRLKAGDRVTLRGRHNGAFAQWTYSGTSSRNYSHMSVVYLAP